MAAPTPAKSLNLSVSNFGPIIEADIDLRPLTVFVGPSNAGKSYMATLIYALHRFFSGGYGVVGGIDSVALRELKPSGVPNRSDIPQDALDDMTAWLKRAARGFAPDTLPKSVESLLLQSLVVSDSHSRAFTSELLRCFGKDGAARLARYGSREEPKVAIKSSVGEDAAASLEHVIAIAKNGKSVFRSSPPKALPPEIAALAAAPYIGNSVWTQRAGDAATDCGYSEYEALKSAATIVGDEFIAPLSGIVHYIPAGRTNIMRARQTIASSPAYSGLLDDFLQSLAILDNPAKLQKSRTTKGLSLIDLPRRSPPNSKVQKTADRIEKNMLGGGVQIAESHRGYPQFQYRPSGWKEPLPLTSASSMVSELAPIVLYLRHVVSPGDTLIIEEPESHLHPAMQVEFARQLAAVARAGVRVIITTHSEWILDELSNLTLLSQLDESNRDGISGADCALDPESVGVWLFRPKDEGTSVKEIPFIDEYGGYSEDYADVALENYNSHAEIFNRVQEAKGE